MKKYPKDYNPILEYWEAIESGREVVCEKIRRTYKKLANDLTDKNSEFFYSCSRANHIIEFAENFCRHSKGKWGGRRVVLELWEKAALATIFGFINIEGIRKYQRAILIVAKKNGKSLLASIVGLYLMVADGEAGPEVYAVATKKDQAKIIWTEAKRMVKKSPPLHKKIKTLVAEMTSDFNDGIFKPLASDSDTLDGPSIQGGLMDEFHQWKNGRALYDIIVDGISAREQPLIFMTSTAGMIREDIYDEIYDEITLIVNGYFDPDGYKDDRTIAFVYELDKREEWIKPECYKKANPGLGTIKNERTLLEKVERAKQDPKLVKNLVCKEFNIRETSTEAWQPFEVVNNTATFKIVLPAEGAESGLLYYPEPIEKPDRYILLPRPRYGIGGGDLSQTTDLTSGKVIFMVPGDPHVFVIQMYWLPKDLIDIRVREDKIPYDKWYEQGKLRTTPGRKVHYKFVTDWFKEVREAYDLYIPWTGYDGWSAEYWVEEMKNEFGPYSMIPVIQGKKTLSSPMHLLGRDFESKLIVYNNNPIDKWCFTNVKEDRDKNDNIQPIKTSKPRRRIDGFSSLLDAYTILQEKYGEYTTMI